MEGSPERRATVGTGAPEYAGANAEYTSGTDWLGREDWRAAPSAKKMLDSASHRYQRTELLLAELLGEPRCRPHVRRQRVMAHQIRRKRKRLAKRSIREGPLYQAPSEYRCDRRFVRTVDEMIYIKRANASLQGCGDTRKGDVFLRVAKCIQCPPLWRKDHRAYIVMKRMKGLRRLFGEAVDAVDCTLFQGDGVRWDRSSGNSQWTTELSWEVFVTVFDCVSEILGTLRSTVALPL